MDTEKCAEMVDLMRQAVTMFKEAVPILFDEF